jgi:GntR family transcriptional regulator/MocR family aminotransferase
MIYGLNLDRKSPVSLTAQLINELRNKILSSQLAAGERLCATRELAMELGLARNTVITAYEQLISEGYLESRTGSGTYVANLKKVHISKSSSQMPSTINIYKTDELDSNSIQFDPGSPDNSAFPNILWGKSLKEACLMTPQICFGYSNPEGEIILKKALCEYLQRSKGIVCHPEQIIIVPGSSGGISLLSKLFYSESASVIIEDPSITFVRNIFSSSGYLVQPIPVDKQGMQTELLWNKTKPKLIYAVPSHQFPTGAVLPVARKLELIEYALETDSYIIEDDYDSEFKYSGVTIQSLYNLNSERTIYLGTFSKIFSPAIRLGYLILPSHLYRKAVDLMDELIIRADTLSQLAMAYFMNNRLLDRHIYKMKRLYAGKRKLLIQCLNEVFKDQVIITGENAGLHLMAEFNHKFTDQDFIKLSEQGVIAECAEDYAIMKGFYQNKLILGYGNLTHEQIKEGVKKLQIIK